MPRCFHPMFRALISTVFLLAGLAGCGGGQPTTDITQTTESAAAVDGFGLVSADASTYDGRASVLLTFSMPLAGAQKFDDLLAIKDSEGGIPSGSWVLENEGRELRFPYLASNKSYTVTLKAPLAAVDGSTIGKDTDQSVHTGPLEPILGFASQGSVLPAHESRGLPVVTVNVSDLDVEFLRVRDKHLNTFLGEFSAGGRRSYWSLEQMSKYADSVYSNRFAIEGVPNERTLTYLPIRDIEELSAPGLYFAVMKRGGAFPYEQDTSLFFVSDIGLHVRHYPNGLLVHAASLESGEPKSGVKLVVRDAKGILIAKSETDDDGVARFENYSLKSEHLLLAQKGDDLALLPFNQPALDISEFAVSGRPQRSVEIFPWASRDLYRPGETVTVSALLRDHDGAAIPAQPVFATLRQPDGKAVVQQQLGSGALGYYEFTRSLPADAATGRWSVDFATDPESSDRAQGFSFRVEEFLPERLKLELTSTADQLQAGAVFPVRVDADYLHGAPAAGNRFTARLVQLPQPHPIEALKDFHFGDARAEMPEAVDDLIDARLDGDGKLSQDINLPGEAPPTTPIEVVLAGSVHETGGRAVTRSLKRTVWPASELVGMRPLFDLADGASPDADASFEIIRANAAGELLAADRLTVKVIREARDYQWRYVDNTGWTFDFTTRDEAVLDTELTIAAGARGKLSVPVTWGSYRLEITDPVTKLVLRQPFEAGWGSSESRGLEARPDKVKVVLDKPSYTSGETATITLTAPHEGPALLMLEGDNLLWHRTMTVGQGTTVELPLDPAWNRHDLYFTALVFRPGSSADAITPNRAVGIAHVPLNRGDRKIEVTVQGTETMRPMQPLTLEVVAPSLAGKQANVRLSATDAGVLNMTSFPVPDAAAWFFAPRRFGVDSYDVYGRVIESFAGNQARLRYGGDAAVLALPQGRRPNTEIRIVDLLAAPVTLDANGKAKVLVNVPDFNGTLRIRAVVYGDQQFGAAQHETIVRAPVIMEASLPRVLAPGDDSRLTLDLDNASGKAGEFNLQFDTEGPIAVSGAPKIVTLADGERTTLSIPLQARDGFGIGRIQVKLKGSEVALDRSFSVVVRAGWPAVQRMKLASVTGGSTVLPDTGLRDGLYPASVVQRISIGRLPPMPYVQSAQALLQYPYGCAEQTTSRAMPLVLLDDETRSRLGIEASSLRDQNNQPIDVSGPARAASLETAFARLATMQNESGHFSLWPGEGEGSSVITPYVVELLLQARAAGHAIPAAMLDKALERLLEDVLKGGNTHYEFEHYEHMRLAELAHAGYVLALAGKAPLGTLRAVYDNEREKLIAPLPLAHLGAALAIAGDKSRAASAFKDITTREWKRPEWLGDYGSKLRDDVVIAALAREQGMATQQTDALAQLAARDLLGERGNDGNQWLSTQEQIAILRLGKAMVAGNDGVFSLDVQKAGSTESLTDRRYFSSVIDTNVSSAVGTRLLPKGEGDLFVVHEVGGVPRQPIITQRDDMQVERRWYRPDGTAFTGEAIKEGEVLVAAITVRSKRAMSDALITDLLPGGLEVENLNLTDVAQWTGVEVAGVEIAGQIGSGSARYEEYRDDRYAAAVNLYEGSEVKLFYLLRAVTPGNYLVPPVSVEDMYRPWMRASGVNGQVRINVTPP